MHIGRHIIQELVLEYGEPIVARWEAELSPQELSEVEKHRERGRAHDVSLVIQRQTEAEDSQTASHSADIAVIRKPGYPAGGFRIPSGGIHPEESFLDGATREAFEETGLRIELQDYLLQVHVSFTDGQGRRAKWTTHAMLARTQSGELEVHDREEIEEVRWMSWDELIGQSNALLRDTAKGGLSYRARLHDELHGIVTARAGRATSNEQS